MKKIFFLIICIIPAVIFGQELKEFKAPNGKTYHVGDTVKVGMGSMPDGNFKYIQVTPPPFMPQRRSSNDLNARKGFAMSNAVIRKIKNVTPMDGSAKVMFTVKAGGIGTYDVWIVESISACEVTPCSNQTGNSNPNVGVADELLKLKKLLDSGAITQDEYNKQKKKLLGD